MKKKELGGGVQLNLLQGLECEATHPPNVGIEDEDISTNPFSGMFLNRIHLYNSLTCFQDMDVSV